MPAVCNDHIHCVGEWVWRYTTTSPDPPGLPYSYEILKDTGWAWVRDYTIQRVFNGNMAVNCMHELNIQVKINCLVCELTFHRIGNWNTCLYTWKSHVYTTYTTWLHSELLWNSPRHTHHQLPGVHQGVWSGVPVRQELQVSKKLGQGSHRIDRLVEVLRVEWTTPTVQLGRKNSNM